MIEHANTFNIIEYEANNMLGLSIDTHLEDYSTSSDHKLNQLKGLGDFPKEGCCPLSRKNSIREIRIHTRGKR